MGLGLFIIENFLMVRYLSDLLNGEYYWIFFFVEINAGEIRLFIIWLYFRIRWWFFFYYIVMEKIIFILISR